MPHDTCLFLSSWKNLKRNKTKRRGWLAFPLWLCHWVVGPISNEKDVWRRYHIPARWPQRRTTLPSGSCQKLKPWPEFWWEGEAGREWQSRGGVSRSCYNIHLFGKAASLVKPRQKIKIKITRHSEIWRHSICWKRNEVSVKVGPDAGIWPLSARPFLPSKCPSKYFPFNYLSAISKERKKQSIFSSEVHWQLQVLHTGAADAIIHEEENLMRVFWLQFSIRGLTKDVLGYYLQKTISVNHQWTSDLTFIG